MVVVIHRVAKKYFPKSDRLLALAGLVLALYIFFFPVPPPPKPGVPAPPPPRPVVRFPDLTVQGLTVSGSNSSSVINGRVVHLGEQVEGVQVIEIDSEGVGVVLDGQTNRIGLTR